MSTNITKPVSAQTYARQLNLLNKLYISNEYDNLTLKNDKIAWISKLLDIITTQRTNPGISQLILNRMEEDRTARLISIPEDNIAVHEGITYERERFKKGETNADMHSLG